MTSANIPSALRNYRAYGLTIRSSIALPELETAESDAAELIVETRPVEGPLPEEGLPRLIRFTEQDAYLAWPMIGRFRAEREGRIAVDPLTHNAQHVRFALLGPVLGAYLHQRGLPLLHGSAVKVGDCAYLLLGRKGAGKSTLAAAFAANGCDVLNDDVLPLEIRNSTICIAPGFPGLKLSTIAKEQLLPDADVIVPEDDGPAKLMVRQSRGCATSVPIGAIFILDGRATEIGKQKLRPANGLEALLENSYALKFGEQSLVGKSGATLFRHCAQLAQSVPIWTIHPPIEIERLRTFASSLVVEHRRQSDA